ncbi:MAG: hypothetical protein IH991_10355 [Planctomycetes bacterium]|nr:hypothetical protein [Planctomycetota bacterium]
MKRSCLCIAILLGVLSHPLVSSAQLIFLSPPKADLVIKTFVFAKPRLATRASFSLAVKPQVKLMNDKLMKVHVRNVGKAPSQNCRLRLTIRRINGVPVGRMKEFKVPPLAAGQGAWILVDATPLLPKNVALKDTTFRLDVDSTDIVNESKEKNNRKWHNL